MSTAPGDAISTDPGLLTPAEHRVISLLGQAASTFRRAVLGAAATASCPSATEMYDLAEFVDKVHQLQHTIMAQAAARAYPDLYRLAGGDFSD